MVDASSSVASSLEDFRRAVEEFTALLAPDDRVSLLKFDDRVELLQDWTASRVQLRRSLRRVTPGMFTRFHDALYLAARELFKDARRRHAVVVLTDGIDSGRGHASLEMALGSLLEAGVSVYVHQQHRDRACTQARRTRYAPIRTALNPALQRTPHRRPARISASARRERTQSRRITTATGGRLFKPQSFAALDSVYAEVAEELRHQYALYTCPSIRRATEVSPRAGQDRRPALRLSTRIGYFAPRS
jgi:VWFA-related protein